MSRPSKKRSTPGRKLLESIVHYDLFDFLIMPVHDQPMVHPDGRVGRREVNIFDRVPGYSAFRKNLRNAIDNRTERRGQPFIEQDSYGTFLHRCFLMAHNPDVFLEVPSLSGYRKDVGTFNKIAARYPGLIPEAAQRLHLKYSSLYAISPDYSYWFDWQLSSPLRDLPKMGWDQFLQPKEDHQGEAVRFSELVLDAIPDNEDIIGGTKRHLGLRWFLSLLQLCWNTSRFPLPEYERQFIDLAEYISTTIVDLMPMDSKADLIRVFALEGVMEGAERNPYERFSKQLLSGEGEKAQRWKHRVTPVRYYGGISRFSVKNLFLSLVILLSENKSQPPNSRKRRLAGKENKENWFSKYKSYFGEKS